MEESTRKSVKSLLGRGFINSRLFYFLVLKTGVSLPKTGQFRFESFSTRLEIKKIKPIKDGLPVRNSSNFSKVEDSDLKRKQSTQCPVHVDYSDQVDDSAKEITNQKADLFLKYIHR